jgi:hypothetical protein
MILNVIFLVILAAAFALLFREGLWSNTISLFNTITAALLATNYFEPVSRFLSGIVPYMDYNWDVIVLGVLFALFFAGLRQLSLLASRYRVRFHPLADSIGGGFMALWTTWVGICFICFAMHTAPMSRVYVGGNFNPEQEMFFGTAPDRLWLGFVRNISDGGGWGRNQTDDQGRVLSMFDPQGDFMLKYASRRAWLEKHESPFADVQ